MAVESKPFFHPEVLRQQVRSFNLPEQTAAWQPKLQHWADLISSGRADEFKETALLRLLRTAPRLGNRRARAHQPVLRPLRGQAPAQTLPTAQSTAPPLRSDLPPQPLMERPPPQLSQP